MHRILTHRASLLARDPQGNVNNVMTAPSERDSAVAENDANVGRRPTTATTLEGGENGRIDYDSTTNLLSGPGEGVS